jgi:NAD(P)-dependent dehydrogenase (short-subunit alcohol dehydrogenase family)
MKTVIITGAGGNLGSVVTRHFLSAGYQVIGTVHKEKSREHLPVHDKLDIRVVDLSRESATRSFAEDIINRYRKIDAAFLLAGGFVAGNLNDTDTNSIRGQIALNFETAYHLAQVLYPHMLQHQYGRIVFIGSKPALQASLGKNMVAYSLAKSLLFRLAEYINEDAKGRNVTASVIVPGTIDTADNRKNMPKADHSEWVKPEAIAGVLEFILSSPADPLRETVLKMYNS